MMNIGRGVCLPEGQTVKRALTVLSITSQSYIIAGAELMSIGNKD